MVEPACKEEERVKVGLEDNKAVLILDQKQKSTDVKKATEEPTIKLELSCETEKHVKVDLEDSKAIFASKKLVEDDHQTLLKDIKHERAEPEDEEPEVDPNDLNFYMACPTIDAELGFLTITIVPEEEENLGVSLPNIPFLQDFQAVLKTEDEQKPKVEDIARDSELSRVRFEEEKPKIEVVENSDVKIVNTGPPPNAILTAEITGRSVADKTDPNDMEIDLNEMKTEQTSASLTFDILQDHEGPENFVNERMNNVLHSRDDEMPPALENGKKRGRMIVEVVVDTYANFLKRKKEEFQGIKKMINPETKKTETNLEYMSESLQKSIGKQSKSRTQAHTLPSKNDKEQRREPSVESELTELDTDEEDEEEERPKKKQKITFEVSNNRKKSRKLVYIPRGTRSRPKVL